MIHAFFECIDKLPKHVIIRSVTRKEFKSKKNLLQIIRLIIKYQFKLNKSLNEVTC